MRPVHKKTKLRLPAVIVRGGVGVLALAVALALFQALFATRTAPPRVERGDGARLVRVMTAVAQPVSREWEGFGTARARERADIAVEVAGLVVERPEGIQAGAWVRAGDLLLALDASEYEQRLARARAVQAALEAELAGLGVELESAQESLSLAQESVALMEREVERYRAAVGRGGTTEVELERLLRELTRVQRDAEDLRQRLHLIPTRRARLEAQIGAERASAELAAIEVRRARITAPFTGVLQDVYARPGERVAPGTLVARLVDLRVMEVPLRVPASAAAMLRVGDEANLRSDGPDRRAWPGRVARIAPEADPQTRTATVFVEITQEGGEWASDLLLPGRFLVGAVRERAQRELMIAPRTSIVSGRVMVVDDDGRVSPREVEVGFFLDAAFPDLVEGETQWAVIERGLTPGDRVVVSNLDDLAAGTLVSPVRAGAASP